GSAARSRPNLGGPADRERERERAALARRALDPDAAAVQLHETLAEGEAQAGALTRTLAADLLELLKDAPLIVRRDANAGVLHFDADVTVLRANAHLDTPAVGGEFRRVGQQVV